MTTPDRQPNTTHTPSENTSTKPRKNRTARAITWAAAVCLVVVITLICLLLWQKNTHSAATNFINHVTESNYRAAYELFSDELRQAQSQEYFASLLESNGINNCQYLQTQPSNGDSDANKDTAQEEFTLDCPAAQFNATVTSENGQITSYVFNRTPPSDTSINEEGESQND